MSYYILEADQSRGPFTIGQLRSMWSTGSITTKTMHYREGDAEWRPLRTILHVIEPPAPSAFAVRSTKSRGIYIILGILLGLLGMHNFYAGHHGRGAAQLVITVLLGWGGIGIVITGIWVFIDLLSVTHDADGQSMT